MERGQSSSSSVADACIPRYEPGQRSRAKIGSSASVSGISRSRSCGRTASSLGVAARGPGIVGTDPVAPARGGRLDALGAAARQQLQPDLLGPAFLVRDMLGQICGQRLRFRGAALAEDEVLPDLSAVYSNVRTVHS